MKSRDYQKSWIDLKEILMNRYSMHYKYLKEVRQTSQSWELEKYCYELARLEQLESDLGEMERLDGTHDFLNLQYDIGTGSEFIRWDGTEKHYLKIKEFLRYKGFSITLYGKDIGLTSIEFLTANNSPSLCRKNEYLKIPKAKTEHSHLSSITEEEFKRKYNDWQLLNI